MLHMNDGCNTDRTEHGMALRKNFHVVVRNCRALPWYFSIERDFGETMENQLFRLHFGYLFYQGQVNSIREVNP